jgi:hypothetical protein
MRNLVHTRRGGAEEDVIPASLRPMRYLGALALFAVGAVHLQQYLGADYQAIPTIGSLFLLNAIGAAVVGIALLLPVERLMDGRWAQGVVGTLALSAVAIAVGSLVALFISESTSLFGFTEAGYRAAVVVAIIAESGTTMLLAPVATVSLARAFSRNQPRPKRGGIDDFQHGSPSPRAG